MANVVSIIIRAFDQTGGALPKVTKQTNELGDALSGVQKQLVAAFSIGALTAFAKSAVDAAAEWRRTQGVMEQASSSSLQAGRNLEYVRKEAGNLGLDLQSTAKDFAKLNIAAQGTKLEGEGARQIFLGLAQASSALHLSQEQLNGMMVAVEQMMSKGVVQTQELKLQLGNALPGAMNIAARAAGTTAAGLMDMLEKGQVLSEEFLPKFAAELQRTFKDQAESNGSSFQGAMNKAKNSIDNVQIAFGEGLIPVVEKFANLLAENSNLAYSFSIAGQLVADVLTGIATIAYTAYEVLKTVGRTLYVVGETIGTTLVDAFLAAKEVGESWFNSLKRIVSSLGLLVDAVRESGTALGALSAGDFKTATEAGEKAAKLIKDGFVGAFSAIKDGAVDTKDIAVRSAKGWTDDIDSVFAQFEKDNKSSWQAWWLNMSKIAADQGSKIAGPKTQTQPPAQQAPGFEFSSEAEAFMKRREADLVKLTQLENTLARESAKTFSDSTQSQIASAKVAYDQRVELINSLELLESERLRVSGEAYSVYQEQIEKIATQMRDQMTEASLATVDAELFAESKRYENRLQQIDMLQVAEDQKRQLRVQAESANAAAVSRIWQDEAQRRKQIQQQQLQSAAGFFGNLATVAQAFGKSGFAAYKAMASAQALVGAYLAANNALATPAPWPIPQIFAAAALAAGVANVAAINSQHYGGAAHGGLEYVPAETTYLLERGERVLSPNQNAALMEFMEGNGPNSAPQSITVNVDGRSLFRILLDGSESGELQLSHRAIRS